MIKSYKTDITKIFTVVVRLFLFFAIMSISSNMPTLWASTGKEDLNVPSGYEVEKPKPVFTSNGNEFTAKYIPLAKSTYVLVNFQVKGGKLAEVKGMDFAKAARPDVDIKNYKSALFVMQINDISPVGSDVKVSLSSDFFTSGTEYHIFNEKLPQPWFNSECHNVASKGQVRELMVTVKDGGPFDSDGQANGSITFVGAPRDSFWGYALGTLFIRFFGIFLVLGVLMIGMILSGMFFSRADSKNGAKESDDDLNSTSSDLVDSGSSESELEPEQSVAVEEADSLEQANSFDELIDDYEIAAAIATALHLHFQSQSPLQAYSDSVSSSNVTVDGNAPTGVQRIICPIQQANTWSNDGRSQMMRERQQTYNRTNR